MNRMIMTICLSLMLAATPVMAQMMGSGGAEQQQPPAGQQYNQYPMYPGMMGGYGYGMGPGMMGRGYGYGMGPGMMGGYGYGRGPGMMGPGYGYGMGPGMMGPGYGYGMGYGGGYGPCPLCRGYQGPQFSSPEEYSKFLDATREKRKKLNNLMFEYDEEQFSSEPDQQKLKKLAQEIDTLRSEIFNYEVK